MSSLSRDAVRVALAALVLVAACREADPPGPPPPEPIAVPPASAVELVAGHTRGTVSSATEIRIHFSRSLIGEDAVGTALPTSPFDVQPSVRGTARWTAPDVLALRPDAPLAAGQYYLVAVDPDAVPGLDEPFSFDFEVMAQSFDVQIEGLVTPPGGDGAVQDLVGSIRTADVADTAKVEWMLSADHDGRPLTARWEHDEGARRHRFTLAGIARGDDETEVTVRVRGSALDVDREITRTVEVPALSTFDLVDVHAVVGDDRHLEARFSDPLDRAQDLAGLVRVPGDPDLRFVVDGNRLRVYRADAWPSELEVVFESGIRNVRGARLAETLRRPVRFERLPPAVRFVGRGVLLPSSSDLTIPIETASLSAVDVRAIRVHAENLPQFLQVNPLDGDRELGRVGTVVWRYTVPLDPDVERHVDWTRHGLDLGVLVSEQPGDLFQIELSFRPEHVRYPCDARALAELRRLMPAPRDDALDTGEEHSHWGYFESVQFLGQNVQRWEMWQNRKDPCHPGYYRDHGDHEIRVTRNVLVTDLGLVAKRGTDGSLLVLTTDLKAGVPRASARVKVLDFQQQVLAEGVTDGSGMVRLSPGSRPFLVLAEEGGDRSVLRLQEGASLSVSHFDVGGLTVSEGLKGFIYGERGVWRPGDDIHLTFILHDPAGRMPADHPVRFELLDPRGRVVDEAIRRTSTGGFYAFHTRTEEGAPTGNYRARIRAGGAVFEEVLKVETVMPNRLEIEIDLDEETPLVGREARIDTWLSATWLHGAIAHGLRAQMEMRLVPRPTRFARFTDYHFDDPTRRFTAESQIVFEGRLDDEGRARVNETFATGLPPGMLEARITTRVFEEGGAFSIDHFSVPVAPYERFLGVRAPPGDATRGMLLTDEKHPLRIVAVDAAGEKVRGDLEVDVALYKIGWRWWWETGPEDLPDFTASASHTPIQEGTVRLRNGEGVFEFEVKYPDWGRYLVLARDRDGRHRAGQIVFIDWPGWAGRAQEDMPGGAHVLTLATEKTRHAVGETAKVTIPAAPGARALVSLETGSRVLRAEWVETGEGPTVYEIPVDASMVPGVYVHVTLVQPHLQTRNDRPMRLYGVVPIEVEDPKTRLSPTIETADVFEPESTVRVNVAEESGRPMAYTLAVVDEGLLGLTRHRTPDPWHHFHRREALGVSTWDVYDDVAGAHGGTFARLLAIGGDEDGDEAPEEQRADRFPPVVRHLGPFALAAGETAAHDVRLPAYVGAVRVMVVAGHEGAYGRAEKTVPVKRPLMLLATLPRVLGPGETVDLPVSVFALEDGLGEVTVRLETSEGLAIAEGPERRLRFDRAGDRMAAFRLDVGHRLGVETVRLSATAGGERAEQTLEIDVRHPGVREVQVLAGTLGPGERWTPEVPMDGQPGSHALTLEVSRIQPLNLRARLDYLIGYPHGCLEQILSRAAPQLHLASLVHLDEGEEARIARHVQAAVRKVAAFQTDGGGFGYWPGDDHVHDWTSSYVGQFLIEAREAGHPVSAGVIRRWQLHQRRTARAWSTRGGDRADLDQAYRLYTLALSGEPELSAMNRLREAENLSSAARWRLAAAYHLAGQPEAAQSLVAGAAPVVASERELSNTFGSPLRDRALVLETAVLLEDAGLIRELVAEIAADLSSRRWLSTQEVAFALMALARAADRFDEGGSVRYAFSWQGADAFEVEAAEVVDSRTLHVDAAEPPALWVENTGTATLFPRLVVSALPEPGRETAATSGLRVEVGYFDREGRPVDPDRVEQGTDLSAKITVTNLRRDRLPELALTHVVPSGWEIRNRRLGDGGDAPDLDHLDVRDDRIHAYFGLEPGASRTLEVDLHAAYPGRFYRPGTNVEAMYDATIHGRTRGGWTEVLRPGLSG